MTTSRTQAKDEDLVRQSKDGCRESFDELVLRYQDRIFHLIYRSLGDEQDARELTQEAFIKAFRSLTRFREEAAFSTWLYRIAINLSTSKKRKYVQQRKLGKVSLDAVIRTRSGDLTIEPEDDSLEPTAVYHRKETKERIETAIASLDEPHRQMVVLRDLEGLSYEEIAELLEIPIGTVRSRLHRARLDLREQLRDLL